MQVSPETGGSFEEEYLYGKGSPVDSKMGDHKVGKIDAECLSHHVRTPSAIKGDWSLRKMEFLSANHKFGKNIIDAVREARFVCVCGLADIEITNDPNRGDNSYQDSLDERSNRGNERDRSQATIADVLEQFGNQQFGTAIRDALASQEIRDALNQEAACIERGFEIAVEAAGEVVASVGNIDPP